MPLPAASVEIVAISREGHELAIPLEHEVIVHYSDTGKAGPWAQIGADILRPAVTRRLDGERGCVRRPMQQQVKNLIHEDASC